MKKISEKTSATALAQHAKKSQHVFGLSAEDKKRVWTLITELRKEKKTKK